MENSDHLHAPAAFNEGINKGQGLYRGLGQVQGQFGDSAEMCLFPLPGIEPRLLNYPARSLFHMLYLLFWAQNSFIWNTKVQEHLSQYSMLRAGPMNLGLIPSRGKMFFSSSWRLRYALGPFSYWENDWCVKPAAQLHLVPRLRMCGAIPPLPYPSYWCGAP